MPGIVLNFSNHSTDIILFRYLGLYFSKIGIIADLKMQIIESIFGSHLLTTGAELTLKN